MLPSIRCACPSRPAHQAGSPAKYVAVGLISAFVLVKATSDAAFGTGAPPELAATVEQILELCAHCLCDAAGEFHAQCSSLTRCPAPFHREASPGAVRGLVQGGGHRPLTRCLQPGASALGPVPDLAGAGLRASLSSVAVHNFSHPDPTVAAQCLFIALDDNPELAAAVRAMALLPLWEALPARGPHLRPHL